MPRPPAADTPTALDLDMSDRTLADRLLEEGDLAGLRALAIPSPDPYVRRRLARFYSRQHDLPGLKDLATFSNRACRELAETLIRDGDIGELLRQVVCGNGSARNAIERWPIEGLPDDERARILQNGLNADGTIARQLRTD